MNNEIIRFVNGDLQLDVTVSPDNETVWLNRNQIAQLFGRDIKTIGKHINNALKEELSNEVVVAKFATTSQHGAIEGKTQTVSIQSRMLASTLGIEEKEVLNVIEAYSNALSLLDDYDHGTIPKPDGIASIYRLTYEECRELIDSMKYGNFSDVFGVEKEKGKLNGILAAIYQNVFGTELYPSIEEKATNLLYFLIKDHPFVDGCKRIGASIFLEFLNKNKHLIIDGKQIISDSALVAITLMIAESRPEEKETMVKLVMNFLKM